MGSHLDPAQAAREAIEPASPMIVDATRGPGRCGAGVAWASRRSNPSLA